MANINIDNSLVDFTDFSAEWETQFYRNRTATLINTAVSNGAARLTAEMTVETESAVKRRYVEGVMLAAAYSFDTVTMVLPDIFYKYQGTGSTYAIKPAQSYAAGSNAVSLRVGPTYVGKPSEAMVYQGMLINFSGDTTLYRVNSYNATSGDCVIFPILRKAVTNAIVVEISEPTFTGHITNTPKAKYFNGALSYVSYDFDIEEAL
jgi:hypothetical protein|tara:strand:+ start:6068 stop:6685 length:618 start_codon:yes stop_codon:yes gene_type:complete